MSYGFNIVNADGFIQIDDTYSNYYLVASGTAVSPPAGTSIHFIGKTGGTVVSFPTQAEIPLLFIRFSNTSYYFILQDITTSSFMAVISNSGNALAALSFEYRVYSRRTATAPRTGYGLQVFNASGGPIYSSNDASAVIGISTTIPITLPITISKVDVGASNPFFLANNSSALLFIRPTSYNSSGVFVFAMCTNGTTMQCATCLVIGLPQVGQISQTTGCPNFPIITLKS